MGETTGSPLAQDNLYSGLGMRLTASSCKKCIVTETVRNNQETAEAEYGYGEATVQIPGDDDITCVDTMTLLNQSREEVQRPTTSLTKPKEKLHIGCWNVRTLFTIGKSAQLAREMDSVTVSAPWHSCVTAPSRGLRAEFIYRVSWFRIFIKCS